MQSIWFPRRGSTWNVEAVRTREIPRVPIETALPSTLNKLTRIKKNVKLREKAYLCFTEPPDQMVGTDFRRMLQARGGDHLRQS